jgi:SAM-dependent methyltransferase
MPLSAIHSPELDPTPIFEFYRARFASELLAAAIQPFDIFGRLTPRSMLFGELRQMLQLEERPAIVLVAALRAMKLLVEDEQGRIALTSLAREHLVSGAYFSVADYVRLSADSPGVLDLVERLRTNRPANFNDENSGAAFIFREGIASAMEKEESARSLTLALAGRAKNVAPVLAERVPLGRGVLLDVGGGTGIYTIALLQKNPGLRAIVLDRPEVLRICTEFANEYAVSDRLEVMTGDMFATPLPDVDFVLLSNVLHDWDIPECRHLVQRCADVLRPNGRLLIHDVLLNDALDGPLAIACYSALLFTLTEGRAYSAAEFRSWLSDAGLTPDEIVPTLAHCHVVSATKAQRP